jgi:hypothetical protein
MIYTFALPLGEIKIEIRDQKNYFNFRFDYKFYSYLCTPVCKEREKEMGLRSYDTAE